jgi:Flp pilus assembly protein TadD
LVIASKRRGPFLLAALLAALALLAGGCASSSKPTEGKSVLQTKSGETGIQVTESEQDGSQVVRITTTFRGQEHTIVLAVDQPVYEVDIPLSLQQVQPGISRPGEGPGAGTAGAGTQGDFQALLIAQYLEKAQAAMIDGVYNEALRQVNLVLMVRPNHVKAHEMKGSIYYAMGNFELANEEFMDFLKNRQGTPQPPLPGGLPAPAPQPPAAQPPSPPGATQKAR